MTAAAVQRRSDRTWKSCPAKRSVSIPEYRKRPWAAGGARPRVHRANGRASKGVARPPSNGPPSTGRAMHVSSSSAIAVDGKNRQDHDEADDRLPRLRQQRVMNSARPKELASDEYDYPTSFAVRRSACSGSHDYASIAQHTARSRSAGHRTPAPRRRFRGPRATADMLSRWLRPLLIGYRLTLSRSSLASSSRPRPAASQRPRPAGSSSGSWPAQDAPAAPER